MPAATLIPVTVNGEARDVPAGLAVPDLLRHLGLDPGQPGLAVALGASVVRRAEWAGTPVEAGDAVEVITATQGG